jgi:hypothetical protein
LELELVAAAAEPVVCDALAPDAVGVGVRSSRGSQIRMSVPSAPDPAGSVALGSTRTDAPAFVGAVWTDVAVPFAVCVVGADWLSVCDWPLEELPETALWPWAAPCVVWLALAAPAVAVELFVCVTPPSSPGLLFRMTTLTFVGATWVEVADAFELCVVGAACVELCDWPPEAPPPVCVCVPCCDIAFSFPELAVAPDVFVCVTGPSFPGLSTRTTTFTFVGATCFEVAEASELCVVGADWDEVCACPEELCACPPVLLGALPLGALGALGAEPPVVEPALWLWLLLCCVVLPFVPLAVDDDVECWSAAPPAATFVGDCCDAAVAVAACCVGALWVTVCDW